MVDEAKRVQPLKKQQQRTPVIKEIDALLRFGGLEMNLKHVLLWPPKIRPLPGLGCPDGGDSLWLLEVVDRAVLRSAVHFHRLQGRHTISTGASGALAGWP